MTILPLYAAPQYAPQVTDWLRHAFGSETLPREFFVSIVQHSQAAEALPLTLVAMEGEQLPDTIGPWRCDLINRQDLFPWLAALYVACATHDQGLVGKLQQHVIGYARRAGFRELYLYSVCRDFYERFGWRYIGEGLDYPAATVHLYRYDLSPPGGATTE